MSISSERLICLDLDNTLVDYEALFWRVAREEGWVHAEEIGSREELRSGIRSQLGGEILWQKLQALVYGPRIFDAKLMEGSRHFLKECEATGYGLCILSHKSRYATQDVEKRFPLRDLALEALERWGLFGEGLQREHVFFLSTTEEKVLFLHDLQPMAMVDDLLEVLLHRDFPHGIQKIWWSPSSTSAPEGVHRCSTWSEVFEVIEERM